MRFALAFVAILVVSWASTGEADKLSENQIKKCFSLLDKDGDKKITIQEFDTVKGLFSTKPTKTEIKDMFNEGDADGNGTIDLSEFSKLMADADIKVNILETFLKFDQDNNGSLNAEEQKQALTHMGKTLTDDKLRKADTDNDGQINFTEFVDMMN